MADPGVLGETERWFVKRGIPHFIHDYRASHDIWTRALPALTLLFLVEAVNAPKESFPIWLNAVAVIGAFAILLGAWALANVLRGRAALRRPDSLGPFEVAVFVLAPPLVPIVFGGQWRAAIATVALNAVLLLVIYFTTSYGILPMTRWGFGQLFRQVGAVLNLLVRALPLLLLFVTFLFVNTEVWQTASGLNWPALALVGALFGLIGTAFAVVRLPRQVGELSTFDSWDVTKLRVARTPAEPLAGEVDEPAGGTPPLSSREWSNVGLVVLVTEGTQILLVSGMIFAFFTLFGFLAISPSVVESWLGAPPEAVAVVDLWGQRMVLSEELLHVAAFLAAFSGLYFTVVLLTDATYREEFLDDVVSEVRDAFAVRAVYRAALDVVPGGPAPGTGRPLGSHRPGSSTISST